LLLDVATISQATLKYNDVYNLCVLHRSRPPLAQRKHRQVPVYTAQQLVVVSRDKAPEVWTLCDFAPGGLVFAPETHEVKDCRLGRSRVTMIVVLFMLRLACT
jgi:hypothetical protein